MVYKNTEAMVHLPDRDTDYFDINAEALQGDTLESYLFILYLDYVLRR